MGTEHVLVGQRETVTVFAALLGGSARKVVGVKELLALFGLLNVKGTDFKYGDGNKSGHQQQIDVGNKYRSLSQLHHTPTVFF
jgi:hypothetical protein